MNVNNSPALHSQDIVVEAPMSFTGSAKRIWKLTRGHEGAALWGMGALAVTLIFCAWTIVLTWYGMFGLFVIPYRLIRRGSRNRKLHDARHSEMLQMMNATHAAGQQPQPVAPSLPQPSPQEQLTE